MILDKIRNYLAGVTEFNSGMFSQQRSLDSAFGSAGLFGYLGNSAMHHAMRRRAPINALRNSTVYACIKGTVEVLSTLPFRAVDRKTKESIQNSQSDLLANPNDEQTGVEFWEMMYANLLTHGNAFAEKVYIKGRVEMLLPMCAAKVTVERRNGEKRYMYSDLPGYFFDAQEILHLRLFGPDDLTGMSPIWVAESILCLDAMQEEMLIENAAGGGAPGLIIKIPPEKALERINSLLPGQNEKDAKTIQAQIEGAKSRLALYLPNGYEGTPLATNYREQQVAETRDANVAALARIWGYPLTKLGVLSKSDNASTVEQADLAWYKDKLRPIITKTEKRVEVDLCTKPERLRFQLKVNTRAVLQGDIATQTEQDVQLWQIGAVTTNEIRDWRDLPAYTDPAADKPHWPVNMSTENIPGAKQPTNPADGGVPPARALPIFEDAMGRIARKELAEITKARRSIGTEGMEVNFQDRVRELYSGELLTFIEKQIQPLARLVGSDSEACKAWARNYVALSEAAFSTVWGQRQEPIEASHMGRVPFHAADCLASLSARGSGSV